MRYVILTFLLASAVWAADFREELLNADRAFDRETAALGLDGWMSWFADDAQLNHRSGVIKGKAALREHYGKMIGQPGVQVHWVPLYAESSKDGSLGYTFGAAEWTITSPDGKVEKRNGNYVTVWRRMSDGTWKVVTDIGS